MNPTTDNPASLPFIMNTGGYGYRQMSPSGHVQLWGGPSTEDEEGAVRDAAALAAGGIAFSLEFEHSHIVFTPSGGGIEEWTEYDGSLAAFGPSALLAREVLALIG
jgi:hypothetical protein